jgi:hypothetical protein
MVAVFAPIGGLWGAATGGGSGGSDGCGCGGDGALLARRAARCCAISATRSSVQGLLVLGGTYEHPVDGTLLVLARGGSAPCASFSGRYAAVPACGLDKCT